MRIAVATRHLHRAGGVETYLEWVIPALAARGHDVSVGYEFVQPPESEPLELPGIASYRFGTSDRELIERERPDVIFSHGLSSPAREAMLPSVAPLVVFLHAYNGTCVSETKTFAFPSPRPCSRPLGLGCLLHYYPRRCGGWSPLTMLRSYSEQQRRQDVLRTCALVVTLSAHMRHECVAQGVSPSRVRHLPPFAPMMGPDTPTTGEDIRDPKTAGMHLVFVGRMERLKGGQVLLDALGRLPAKLRHGLRITFAGDGRERERWEQQAERVSRNEFPIRFVGWLTPAERSALFAKADLLVVPSIWPEPLGLVGLEAAAAGLPAIAFDLGGIPEWLTDGVNGRLVPLEGGSRALAAALEDCLATPGRLVAWGQAARAHSQQRTLAAHIDALENSLSEAAGLSTPSRWTRDTRVVNVG